MGLEAVSLFASWVGGGSGVHDMHMDDGAFGRRLNCG
jgi:hypothetical protein